jgi:hypothetical protein
MTRSERIYRAKEGGGPRRATSEAIRDVAIEDAGKLKSPITHRSEERVPASAWRSAGTTSGCSLRLTSNDAVGRSDAIVASTVSGPILASTRSGANDPSVPGNVNHASDHTRTTPMSAVPTHRGRTSSVPTS